MLEGAKAMKPAQDIFAQPVACEILTCFVINPNASDTVEGIVQWRLLEHQIRSSIRETEAALAELVARKLVLERRSADRRSHYRMNPVKEAEIRKRLNLAATRHATANAKRRHVSSKPK